MSSFPSLRFHKAVRENLLKCVFIVILLKKLFFTTMSKTYWPPKFLHNFVHIPLPLPPSTSRHHHSGFLELNLKILWSPVLRSFLEPCPLSRLLLPCTFGKTLLMLLVCSETAFWSLLIPVNNKSTCVTCCKITVLGSSLHLSTVLGQKFTQVPHSPRSPEKKQSNLGWIYSVAWHYVRTWHPLSYLIAINKWKRI